MLTFVLAGIASSEPITTGNALASGISVTVNNINPAVPPVYETLGTGSEACQPASDTCPPQEGASVSDASVPETAQASVIVTEAQTQASATPTLTATLATQMATAAGTTEVLNRWNVRAYSEITSFSALNGTIRADVVEAEAVSGTDSTGATVKAAAASVTRLRLVDPLTGAETPIVFDANVPNQTFTLGSLSIRFWETNWNPTTGAPASGPVLVNALHIVDTSLGVDIAVAGSAADSNYVAPRPPVAVDDSTTTQPGTALEIDVAANDSDPDGNLNRSSVTVTQGPTSGTATCNDPAKPGVCTYTPNAGFTGTDTFTYEICDATNLCRRATVTIGVVPPGNDPPVAVDDTATTPYQNNVVINVTTNDRDPEGNLVQSSVRVTTGPTNGTVTCTDNLCEYTPRNSFAGTDTFTYEVCDNVNQCDPASVTITVTQEAPDAKDDARSTRVGTPITVDVTANDTDAEGNLLNSSVTVTTQPTHGDLVCTDNQCEYTPDPNYVGSDSFIYQVCDSFGACDTATVSITVTNDPPIAVDDAATTPQDSPVNVSVLTNDSDPDGNLAPATLLGLDATNGAVTCNNSICTFTPNESFVGTGGFTYRICDTLTECVTATVTVTITAGGQQGGNQPPTARNDSASTTVGTSIPINVIGNDTDPENALDPTSVTREVAPANGSVTCSDGVCTYTPNQGWEGTDTFVYQVCDDQNACRTATVTVTVAGVDNGGGNNAPDARADSRTTNQGANVTIDVMGNDSDQDGNLVFRAAVVDRPANGTVICNGTSCSYTPAGTFSGTDTFTYQICDTDRACDTATVTITVTPAGGGTPNGPPTPGDDSATTPAGSPVSINVTQNDTDPNDNLSDVVAIEVYPTNGAVVCTEGTCTYTPNTGFVGTDSFEYRVCDTALLCADATVTIEVTAPPNNTGGSTTNTAPVADNDSVQTAPGSSVTVNVVPNDRDIDGNLDPSTVTITVPPAHGAVICNAGSCTYTPEPGYTGTDSFDYRVCDTQMACDTATVVIEVTGPDQGSDNAPPVARDDSKTGRPGGSVTIGVINNDSDPDGDLDPGSVTVTVPPANGSVICLQGKCTYTPDPGFSGNDSFDYRVCDRLGACTTATVTITVPSLNIGEGDGGGAGGPGNGNSGGGGPNDNDGDNGDGPGSNGEPALPGDTSPNAPISLDSPLLGAPSAPLPFTGGEPSFYVGAALNLLLIGMLLLLIERFTRASRLLKPCPASHNHAESQTRIGCSYGQWVKEPRVLLFLIERFGRSNSLTEQCPAWHNHSEAHDSHGCAYGEWS